ncbi:hypothetical protein [Actinomadura citrea]|uniref:Uncharacterized protein n=1 Tax=Actinomadura citrea TaxID=46158 RepID=A0A7Y9GJ87_9ACTN|nr:hypothetical protein [Actinomadura citrea]NYE17336.1 hypothetical protein [Actinomadura citrea]GGT93332.1 hypothetical protein GCM10010177_60890 [Actinomadura citrea]
MKRFPVRAVRELAAEGGTDLLDGHLRGNLDVIKAALPLLPEDARAAVEQITEDLDATTDADPADLPAVLADPPWARKRERLEPLVIKGLSAPEPSVAWAEDGRDTRCEWALPVPHGWSRHGEVRGPWKGRIADFEAGRLRSAEQVALLCLAPVEQVRHLVAGWYVPKDGYGTHQEPERWVPRIAERFGPDALTVVLKAARSRPSDCGHVVVPYAAEPAAELVAGWPLRGGAGSSHAEAWMRGHGPQAARLLLPAAFGKPGKRRDAAEYALHFLARELGRDRVVQIAREVRGEVGDALAVVLDRDADDLVPRKIPEIGRALPATAVRHLLTVLAMSPPDDPDPAGRVRRRAAARRREAGRRPVRVRTPADHLGPHRGGRRTARGGRPGGPAAAPPRPPASPQGRDRRLDGGRSGSPARPPDAGRPGTAATAATAADLGPRRLHRRRRGRDRTVGPPPHPRRPRTPPNPVTGRARRPDRAGTLACPSPRIAASGAVAVQVGSRR